MSSAEDMVKIFANTIELGTVTHFRKKMPVRNRGNSFLQIIVKHKISENVLNFL